MVKKIKITGKGQKKKMKIELASQDLISQYDNEIGEILDAIATALDEPGMREALVTDESSLWDFMPLESKKKAKEYIEKISELLDVEVNKDDYLIDIAKRIKGF